MKIRKSTPRRYEKTDPKPLALDIPFQAPPTLAEQIARFMGQQERQRAAYENAREADPDDFGDDDIDEEAFSPHELVYDQELNRQITRYEAELLNAQRAKFDEAIERKRQADINAAHLREQATREAVSRMEASQQKKTAKKKSADADE